MADRAYEKALCLTAGGVHRMNDSPGAFPDGSHFRLEIATVNSIEAFSSVVKHAARLGLVINRVTETQGIFRHTESELREYVELGAREGIEVVLSVGPRATYDIGASRLSPQGSFVNYRLRGAEQLVRAVEDVRRAVDLGCRNIVVYDEGLLWVLSRMREDGELPSEMKFKASAHMGHANPAAARLLEMLGADSINPVRDLALDMIGALRRAVRVPLDIHTDTHLSSGGFIRRGEAPDIVRLASPVYLKTGMSEMKAHGQKATAEDGRRMAEEAGIVREIVLEKRPDAVQSAPQKPREQAVGAV